ncbi:MAG: hypothetical protein IPJ34_31820 [Myxococcales bacterium]|nr:hypothetical protein [Myxococcales bacterium]
MSPARLIPLFVVLSLTACASEVGVAPCADLDAGACEPGCSAIPLQAYDPAARCLRPRAPAACAVVTGRSNLPAEERSCVQRTADGARFVGSDLRTLELDPAAWTPCSPSDPQVLKVSDCR